MKQYFFASFLAAVALNAATSTSVLAQLQPYQAPSLEQTGFAPSQPISTNGYNPQLQQSPAMTRDASNLGGGTNGNSYEIGGNQGDVGGHNNARTDNQTQYSFERQYRFTGDNQLGTTQTSRQSAIQGMRSQQGGMALQPAQTGLLSGGPGRSFHSGSSFGFRGANGGVYQDLYGRSGYGFLPGVGTGQLDINITNGY